MLRKEGAFGSTESYLHICLGFCFRCLFYNLNVDVVRNICCLQFRNDILVSGTYTFAAVKDSYVGSFKVINNLYSALLYMTLDHTDPVYLGWLSFTIYYALLELMLDFS